MEQNLTDKEVYNKNFASFYNYVLTEQAREYGKYILNYARKNIKGNSVVDYMCGTGNLLKIFEKENWTTTGIDLSDDMLNVAKLQLTKTKLFTKDVTLEEREFKNCFNLAVSTADAVNHLSSIKDIENFFYNVYSSLKLNGLFMFDMNTELGARANCNYIALSTKDYLSVREGFYDDVHKMGYTRFQGAYRKNKSNNYVRYDSTIYNYIYPISQIVDVLQNVGFEIVCLKDGYSDKVYSKDHTERILFICKKENQKCHIKKK